MFTIYDMVRKEEACGVFWGPFRRELELQRLPERIRRQLRKDGPLAYRASKDTPMLTENPPANAASFATTSSEQKLYDQNIWAKIPAMDEEPGCLYVVSCGGVYGTRTSSVGTITIRARFGSSTPAGSTLLATSNSLTPTTSLSAVPWYAECYCTVRKVDVELGGDNSLVSTSGFLYRQNGSAVTGAMHFLESSTDDIVNTTIDQGLLLTWQWSSSNSSNTCTTQWVCFRQLN